MRVYVLQDDSGNYDSDGFWTVSSTAQKALDVLNNEVPENRRENFEIYRVPIDGSPEEWERWKDGYLVENYDGPIDPPIPHNGED